MGDYPLKWRKLHSLNTYTIVLRIQFSTSNTRTRIYQPFSIHDGNVLHLGCAWIEGRFQIVHQLFYKIHCVTFEEQLGHTEDEHGHSHERIVPLVEKDKENKLGDEHHKCYIRKNQPVLWPTGLNCTFRLVQPLKNQNNRTIIIFTRLCNMQQLLHICISRYMRHEYKYFTHMQFSPYLQRKIANMLKQIESRWW